MAAVKAVLAIGLKYELLIIAALVSVTLGTARVLENGSLDFAPFVQKVLNLS
ncbi:MAG: hypothetical protein ACREDO_13295 [Methyloceanibacter sp.]